MSTAVDKRGFFFGVSSNLGLVCSPAHNYPVPASFTVFVNFIKTTHSSVFGLFWGLFGYLRQTFHYVKSNQNSYYILKKWGVKIKNKKIKIK